LTRDLCNDNPRSPGKTQVAKVHAIIISPDRVALYGDGRRAGAKDRGEELQLLTEEDPLLQTVYLATIKQGSFPLPARRV
jgi:hypothetical protein